MLSHKRGDGESMNPEQIAELRAIAKDIQNTDYVRGSGLIIPFANRISASRASMVYNNLPQIKNLVKPESPMIGSTFEKLYGDRSTGYVKLDKDYEVVKKIRKFPGSDMVYCLILKEVGTNYHHIIHRTETESYAESSGTKYNNSILDKLNENDRLYKDDIVVKTESYDDDMNYRYGVNADTVYLVSAPTIEDAIRISDVMADKLSSYGVIVRTVPKTTNDVFINWYGDGKTYKPFPDIGDKCKDGILCVSRRINKSNMMIALKRRNLRKRFRSDIKYYGSGKVVDISIFSNIQLDKIPDDEINSQVKYYLKCNNDYQRAIFEYLGWVRDMKYPYSDDVGDTYARARDIMELENPKVRINSDNNIPDGMIINFTVLKKQKVTVGCKLVGRHGNKGIVSEIVPKEQMPRCEDGRYAEIQFDALGVHGRMNISQLDEDEMSWILNEILIDDSISPKKKFRSILDLLHIVNPDQESCVKAFYNDLDDTEKEKFVKDITNEFTIAQSGNTSVTWKQYEEMINTFNPKKKHFTITDANGVTFNIQRKLIMGKTYVTRLKHEPITKYSLRNKGAINPRTSLPIKTHDYSKGTALFNNQAVKLGTMEMDVLNICNDPAAISYFLRLYCTSISGRRCFKELLDKNIFRHETQIDMLDSKSSLVSMFDAHFLTCGMTLDFEFDDTSDNIHDSNDILDELKDMKKKRIKVMYNSDASKIFCPDE